MIAEKEWSAQFTFSKITAQTLTGMTGNKSGLMLVITRNWKAWFFWSLGLSYITIPILIGKHLYFFCKLFKNLEYHTFSKLC